MLKNELRGCSLFLVGMMGSGKSTLGKMLANTLKYAFLDSDSVVELAHDKRPVADIFQTEGQVGKPGLTAMQRGAMPALLICCFCPFPHRAHCRA